MNQVFLGIVEWIMVFAQLDKLLGFSATPTVNGLFRIAHNHQGSFFSINFARSRIVYQRNQVLPLHFGSILKFVNKKMTIPLAQSFIYKRGWLVLNFTMNNSIEFRNGKHVLFLLNFRQFIANSVQQR